MPSAIWRFKIKCKAIEPINNKNGEEVHSMKKTSKKYERKICERTITE